MMGFNPTFYCLDKYIIKVKFWSTYLVHTLGISTYKLAPKPPWLLDTPKTYE
jgi:hypothetical protein